MKKIIFSIIILLFTTLSHAEVPDIPSNIRHSILFNQNKNNQLQKINLRLQPYKDKFDSDFKANGACLIISGLAFTTAAILEGGSQYGTYKPSNNSVNTQTYVTPPFYQQQPRFTMFVVGIGLTIGGIGLTIN